MNTTDQPAAAPDTVTALGHPAQPAPAAAPITVGASGKLFYTVPPTDTEIIHAVALAFQVGDDVALEWICAMFPRRAA